MKLLKKSQQKKISPVSDPSPSGDESPILFGADATASILNQAVMHVNTIHEHLKPSDPGYDETKCITALPYVAVGRMLNFMTGMYAYAIVEAAKADQEYQLAEYAHSVVKKQALLRRDNGKQKYKLENEVAMLPEVRSAYEELLRTQAKSAMMKAMVEGLKAKMELASREITRRSAETERRQPG